MSPSFAYKLDNIPVGIMKMGKEESHSPHMDITWLATHPGVAGASEAMIEKAVNVSQEKGKNGSLSLTSLDKASSVFYKSVGFKRGGSNLTLNPAKSSKWEKDKNQNWQLRKNAGKGYLMRDPGTPDSSRK